jgi:hypothetical protein
VTANVCYGLSASVSVRARDDTGAHSTMPVTPAGVVAMAKSWTGVDVDCNDNHSLTHNISAALGGASRASTKAVAVADWAGVSLVT